MIKQAKNLAIIAEDLYSSGSKKEARDVFFTSVRLAHFDNPLVDVLEEYGFEPSEIFEYGDDGKLDRVHPSEKSVHRKKGNEAQEIWIHAGPEGIQYGYMHDDGDYGHQHKYFDNLEDLVSHIADEQDKDENTSYEDPGRHPVEDPIKDDKDCGCGCGGRCKHASKNTKHKLNKPFRTPNGPKKFSVYVKNDKGNVVKVNFGDPNMEIKRDDPNRRKNYRARHHCENPGPKWKANYWSCKMWAKPSVTNILKG